MKPQNNPDTMFSIEQSLIASLLVYPEAIDDHVGSLYPSHFANRYLGKIYDAMRSLASRGVAISPTSVGKELRDRGHLRSSDGEQYLHDLWGSSGTAANAQWCVDEIFSAWQKREVVKANTDAIAALHADGADLDEVLDKLHRRLDDVDKCSRPSGPRPMGDDLSKTFTDAKAAASSGKQVRGLSTGFGQLDWWTSGLQPSNLIVLAAQTGMGKTSLAMNIAANSAKQDRGVVVIFSMEMGRSELACRLVASKTGLDLQKLTSGKMDEQSWRRFAEAQSELASVGDNILLDVSGRVTPTTIRAHLRRLSRTRTIALVIVDYLQLCGTAEKAESQYVRTSMISGDLKGIAVDFDVPVLALSQLSREAARRNGEPRLSDLRDSGTIEQDANVVVFIHRNSSRDKKAAELASIIVAKNRNGPIGKFPMHWDAHCVRFSECTDQLAPGCSQ